jgi:hypothetical protein
VANQESQRCGQMRHPAPSCPIERLYASRTGPSDSRISPIPARRWFGGPGELGRRAIAIKLFLLRSPMTGATGCFGVIAMHMSTWSGIRRPSRIRHSPAAPNRGESAPTYGGSGERWFFAVSAQSQHGSCSPIWNGIGSGKAPTLNPPHRRSSSRLRRILLPRRSDLFQSHWPNQRLAGFSFSYTSEA